MWLKSTLVHMLSNILHVLGDVFGSPLFFLLETDDWIVLVASVGCQEFWMGLE